MIGITASAFGGGGGGADPSTMTLSLWYDPSDGATVYEAAADPAEIGDAVSQIDDKSGNAKHGTQATAGRRPIYSQSGAILYLALDGAGSGGGDGFTAASTTLPSDADVFMAVNVNASDTAFVAMFSGAGGSKYISHGEPALVNSYSGAGTPSAVRVNGAALSDMLAQRVYTALSGTGWKILEYNNVNLSTWGTFDWGFYDNLYALQAGVGGIIVKPAVSGERSALRTWLGAKVGLTL